MFFVNLNDFSRFEYIIKNDMRNVTHAERML